MDSFELIKELDQNHLLCKRKIDNLILKIQKIKYLGLNQNEKEFTVNRINEIIIFRHINSIKYFKCIVNSEDGEILLPMEYFENNLLNIKNLNQIDEEFIWNLITQITVYLYDLHNNSNYHGNISIENIFFNNENKIKIGGYSISLNNNNNKEETFQQKDLFDLGILIYQLITNNKFDKILIHKLNNISNELKNLIISLTNLNPSLRPSIQDILSIPDIAVLILEEKMKLTLDEFEEKKKLILNLETEIALKEKKIKKFKN